MAKFSPYCYKAPEEIVTIKRTPKAPKVVTQKPRPIRGTWTPLVAWANFIEATYRPELGKREEVQVEFKSSGQKPFEIANA